MGTGRPRYQETLRRLAIHDERFLASILAATSSEPRESSGRASRRIDDRTRRLVNLAVVVGADGSPTSIEAAVSAALNAGVTPEEVVEAILRIAPAIGTVRTVAIAPHVAAALGYDIWLDLERLGDERLADVPLDDRL